MRSEDGTATCVMHASGHKKLKHSAAASLPKRPVIVQVQRAYFMSTRMRIYHGHSLPAPGSISSIIFGPIKALNPSVVLRANAICSTDSELGAHCSPSLLLLFQSSAPNSRLSKPMKLGSNILRLNWSLKQIGT